MRAAFIVIAVAALGLGAQGLACMRESETPVGSTRVTSADEGDGARPDTVDPRAKRDAGAPHPYDSDYDHPGRSPGITPPSSIPSGPMSRPAPWRGSSGGGSK